MVHTLHVMRENSRVLLATMAVFVNEPSVEWLKAAQQTDTGKSYCLLPQLFTVYILEAKGIK